MESTDLNEAMKRLGITSKALAERMGVTLWAVDSWRTGRRAPCCKFMRREIDKVVSPSKRRK